MIIDIDEFREQWQNRMSNKTLLMHCTMIMFDGSRDHCDIFIDGNTISDIYSSYERDQHPYYDNPLVTKIECSRGIVIPGLCDAHVHVTAFTADLPSMNSTPESLTTARASNILRSMLLRGFTTVRDCGGADHGLAQAIEEGEIIGPRLLFTGHALSQTGGHGDMRSKGEECFSCGAALRGIGRVCDGDAEVRRAARDELRKGAHCIKIMASGGVSSPTDRLTNTQFSLDEITAIVQEAQAHNTYVCAHAYTSEAISRAVQCGVRSIEHGNYLDDDTAALMKRKNAFLVPTIITYAALQESGVEAGMKPELVEKVNDLVEAGIRSLEIAQKHDVQIVFGSDLLGQLHDRQSEEFTYLQKVLSPQEALNTATVNAAALFNMQDVIGKIQKGCIADLIILREYCYPDPDQDIGCLTKSDNLWMIMKEGVIVKMGNE